MSKKAYDKIAAGLTEAIAVARGRRSLLVCMCRAISTCARSAAAATGMTQTAFATTYGFPKTTLRDWEQGRSRPDMAARTYLVVIKHRPDVVREVLAELAA